MKRLTMLVAWLVVATSLALAQRPEAPPPRFEPVQIVTTSPAPYPPTSVAEGTVILELTVSPDGGIEAARVLRGVASLTEAAGRSVRQWTFRPATLNGKPVRATVITAFTFTRPVVLPQQPPK